MKKLLLIIVVTTFSISLVNAQDAKFSLTAGFANVGAKAKVNVDGNSVSSTESEAGFFVGLSADFGVSEKLHIQPSVLYANANEADFLIIPVMAKYYVAEQFNLQAGPQAQLALEESVDGFSNFGIGLGFGVGYDISDKFYLEARYGFELTNRTSDLNANDLGTDVDPTIIGDIDIKTTLNTLTIGIGYKFN